MLPPCNKPISGIAREEGVGEGVPYNWREAVRVEGRLMPDGDTSPSGISDQVWRKRIQSEIPEWRRTGCYTRALVMNRLVKACRCPELVLNGTLV